MRVTVTDDLSGATSFVGGLFGPTDDMVDAATFVRVQGDALNGTYEATFDVPQFAAPGDYEVFLTLKDAVGNSVHIADADKRFGNDFTVTTGSVSDATAPTLTSISLSPWTADVSSGAVSVTLAVEVGDDLSGVETVNVVLRNPAEGVVQNVALVRTAGNASSGTYTTTLTVPALAGPGDYEVELFLKDQAQNGQTINHADKLFGNDFIVTAGAASNSPPVANADVLTAIEDTTVTFAAAQLLGNDTDVDDNAALTIASVTAIAGGSVVLNIDGTVTFTPTVNFNGQASFSYVASDGVARSNSATVTVDVASVNDTPVMTSNGGGDAATIELAENTTTAVTTVEASDTDAGAILTYSIAGGADASRFVIDGGTGALAFKALPDFEAPEDSGMNNVYEIIVGVSDGTAFAAQTLTITIIDVAGTSPSTTGGSDTIDLDGGLVTNESDSVNGQGGDDRIRGEGGNDTIKGGKGSDTLAGGIGKDSLTGGAGPDHFLFDTPLAKSNADVITDFKHGVDVIELDDAIFTKVGLTLTKAEFYAAAGATKAHDRSDRIVYDTRTGKLYYDDDGNKAGGHAPVLFATLSNTPLLDHGDFAIV